MKKKKTISPVYTVLPYMGKPRETDTERKRREYKPLTVYTDGVIRKRPMIRESEE